MSPGGTIPQVGGMGPQIRRSRENGRRDMRTTRQNGKENRMDVPIGGRILRMEIENATEDQNSESKHRVMHEKKQFQNVEAERAKELRPPIPAAQIQL